MNKLDQLRQLLAPPRITRGTVTEIVGDTAHVATRNGGASLKIQPGLLLSVGAHVQIQANVIIGTLRNPADLPVYDL